MEEASNVRVLQSQNKIVILRTTLVLLNFVGMDDGWIQGRYTVDARRILHRIIHTISMLYLYVV